MTQAMPVRSGAESMNAPRVMVVDDYAPNVQLVSFVLEDNGFIVDSVSDAALALARIAAFAPDLILMDIQLPGMDGLQLTRLLRAGPHTRDIVIAAFTAYAMKGDAAKMLAAGCDGYIAKPIEVTTIAEQVRALLRRKSGLPLAAVR